MAVSGSPRTSPAIMAMTVSEPWPMSTVFMETTVEPSALMLTIATDAVGEITAFMPMAMPRPRLIAPPLRQFKKNGRKWRDLRGIL